MRNKHVYAILGVGIIAVTIAAYVWFGSKKSNQPVIAVVTTLSHPALSSVAQGFKSSLSTDFSILEFNAEGNAQQANMIARQIAQNSNIVGILAIGTLAAQTVAKVEKKKPIVIAAVSDPGAIIPPHQADNICGMTDAIDPDYQIKTLLELLPETTSISLLYSPHEANSVFMVKALKERAQARNLRVELVGVYEPQQIQSASINACQISDVVLIPLDNQLVAAMPAVIKATKDRPCPIITSNESPIHQGATIAFGVDYEKSGKEAGIIMTELVQGQKMPKDIGFINPSDLGIFINKRVAQGKNITININNNAKIIDGE